MTRPVRTKRTCAVCGTVNDYIELASTNTMGGPDLDFRPAEMMRSTMGLWIQTCRKCGYVSTKIDEPCILPAEWFRSERYRTSDGLEFVSPLADEFYKQYMICRENSDTEKALEAVLHAAWACDDANDIENAVICRKLAIDSASELIDGNSEDRTLLLLLKADLLRRIGDFDRLVASTETEEDK